MTLGLHDSRSKRRRRLRWQIFKVLLSLAIIVVAGVVAYQGGSILAEQKVVQIQKQVEELERDIEELRRQNDDLTALAATAKRREQDWQGRYEEEVPQGPAKVLYDSLVKRLEDGIDSERLGFVIETVTAERKCDEAPVSKRFIIQTEFTNGGNDAVGFANNSITVTGRGEHSTSTTGNPQAWFDPAKPVNLRFAQIGGEAAEHEGLLPLHYSVVSGANEYRFSALEGPKGFVVVTADRCDYP